MSEATTRPRAGAVLAALLAAVLLLSACSGGSDDSGAIGTVESELDAQGLQPAEGERAQDESLEAEGGDTTSTVDSPVLADRSVIYTVDLVVETEDVRAARDDAEAITARFGGYVQSEGTYGVPNPPLPVEPGYYGEDGTYYEGGVLPYPSADEQATLVLRIPADSYEQAVAALEEIGETISRNRSAQDVTDEVVDVQTRIETQEASIDRLQTLLTEATKISDILAIESELTMRIAELESLKARQEQLGSLTELATVTVSFVPPETVVEEGTGFLAGLEAGWRAFVRSVELGLTALGALLPFVLAFAIIVVPLVTWLVWRHRRRPTTPDPSAEPTGSGNLAGPFAQPEPPQRPEESAPPTDR